MHWYGCLMTQGVMLIWVSFFREGKIHEWCHFSLILVAVYSKNVQWYCQNKPTLFIYGQVGVLGFKEFHLKWAHLWAMTGPKLLAHRFWDQRVHISLAH